MEKIPISGTWSFQSFQLQTLKPGTIVEIVACVLMKVILKHPYKPKHNSRKCHVFFAVRKYSRGDGYIVGLPNRQERDQEDESSELLCCICVYKQNITECAK